MTVAFCSFMMRAVFRMKSSGFVLYWSNVGLPIPVSMAAMVPRISCVFSASFPMRSYFTAERTVALCSVVALQVIGVGCGAKQSKKFIAELGIFLLKYLGVLARLLPRVVVLAILGNLVDEKQRQRFNPLIEEGLLFFEVRFDGLTNLNSPNGHFAHVAAGLSRVKGVAVGETHRVGYGSYPDGQPCWIAYPKARRMVL